MIKVNTDSYAGNFEREMTAYATGMIGQCEVRAELSALFETEEGERFEGVYAADHNGCRRPCSMGGDDNQSVLMFLEYRPNLAELELIRSRAQEYATNKKLGRYRDNVIQINSFELVELTATYKETVHPWA